MSDLGLRGDCDDASLSESPGDEESVAVIPALGTSGFDRWRFVPLVVGPILIATGAANGHWLLMSPVEDDWWLLALSEFQFYGGLLMLGGVLAGATRISALAFFLGILVYDLVKVMMGEPPRLGFGHILTGVWFNIIMDVIILLALVRWRPEAGRPALIDVDSTRLVTIAVAATIIGVVIDRSGIGQFPALATIVSSGSTPPSISSYLLYLPENYHWSSRRWPLILSLHGAGATGDNLTRVRGEGLPHRVEAKRDLPFIIVAPQSIHGGWNTDALNSLLTDVLTKYRVDADRVYLTGLSMGGYGTWAMAAAHPERFAAIAPICGGGDSSTIAQLKNLPTWVFHGAKDRVILPRESEKMVAALKQVGGDVKLTIYPELGHQSWSVTYDNPDLFRWLLAHRRKPAS